MKYKAIFNVNGGLSHGFGLKEPSQYKKEEEFDLGKEKEDDDLALSSAAILAYNLSRNSLSNPETDMTEVTLLELYNEKGKKINQREFLGKYKWIGDKKGNVIEIKSTDNKISFSCHTLEHLLRLVK